MKRILGAALLLTMLFAQTASAATGDAAALRAENAWIRLMPGQLPSAGYLAIHNDSDTPRRLVGASSDAFGEIMLHESMRTSGVQNMRHVDGVDIPARGSAMFEPGAYHLMLMQRARTLKVGEHVIMALHFADGASLSVAFEVRAANSSE
jgi:periplasmic copper chaperone A